MWSGYWRFKFCSVSTFYKMKLIALFKGVGGVSVDEAETIAACPELCPALLAVPVLVTAETGDMLEISRRVI